MNVTAIIPARMASSRFPGKPLADILGLSMIEHVRRRVCLSKMFDRVVVATCDKAIEEEIIKSGGLCQMTGDHHLGCIDRVAEAAAHIETDIIVNVQGDTPLVNPVSLEQLIEPFTKDKDLLCTDLMGPILNEEEIDNPNVVKVVFDLEQRALYYSREPIPSRYMVSSGQKVNYYKQFGIMAFRQEALLKFAQMPRCPIEDIESVDLMRALENGWKIKMVCSEHPIVGVDTKEDLEKAKVMMAEDEFYKSYR